MLSHRFAASAFLPPYFLVSGSSFSASITRKHCKLRLTVTSKFLRKTSRLPGGAPDRDG
jgi:hypothetical protein